MVAQKFQRKGAKMQRRKVTEHRLVRLVVFAFLPLCVFALSFSSCATKPTDMRTLVPAEALVYLETNDLAAALRPIVDSKPFTEVAKSKPDFSALKGVQLAVAVTGFETIEEKVNDEQSIGKVRPRFVAIADTHAWNYQALAFAEHKLGRFVEDLYNSEPKLEKSDKHGGKYFTWTAADGRKAHALVIESLVWFANDETSIDKAISVRRGESDSIIKPGKVPPADPGILACGYVSTDGVAQIANIAAVKIAAESSDDGNLRSTVATVLPELIRSSANDLNWISVIGRPGIEDRFTVTRPQQPSENGKELLLELVDSFFEDIEGTLAEEIAAVIAERRSDTATAPNTVHRREDHSTSTTAERRITTDLGFLGWLIAQLSTD